MKPAKPQTWKELLKGLPAIIIPLLIQIITKNLGGVQGWIARTILKYGGRALLDLINEAVRKHEREQEQEKAKAILEKIKNDPSSTPEQRGEAYEDYFNSGRK